MPARPRSLCAPLTRRSLLALGLQAALLPLSSARAAPAAVVASPAVERDDACLATVTVRFRLSGLRPGTRYAIGGALLELDTTPDNADVCSILPIRFLLAAISEIAQQLTQRISTAQVGLWRGVGPASDEEESADLVELAAQIWLRDLDADEDLGQWQSPPRALVSRAVRQPAGDQRIDPVDLMLPRLQSGSGGALAVRPPC